MAEEERASSTPTGAQVPESTSTTNPTSTIEESLPPEVLVGNPLPSQGSEASVHQESALRIPTPPEDTIEEPGSGGRTAASPASTEEEETPAASGEPSTPTAARLLRSPSVLSDGTGPRPDPPSVLGHREVVAVDYEWVHEFLPRGGDAAETGGSSPSSRPRTTIHDIDNGDDNEVRHRGPAAPPKDATPRYISVPSLDERDQDEDEGHYHQNQNHHPHDPFDADQYDNDVVDYHLDDDEDHRHHLKRVESLLRDDAGGVSGSPLPSVWEHEELLVVPPSMAAEVSQEEEGTTEDVWETAVERQDPRSRTTAPATSSSSEGVPFSSSSPKMRESPAPSYRPIISITEARVYDAPPLEQRLGPSDNDDEDVVNVVGNAVDRGVGGAAAFLPRRDDDEDGLAAPPRTTRSAPPQRSRRNPSPSEPSDRSTRFHTHSRPPPSGVPTQHGFSQYQTPGAPILVRGGRRKIRLRLQEETTRGATSASAATSNGKGSRRSLLGHLRSKSSQMMWGSRDFKNNQLDNSHLDGPSQANGVDGKGPSSYSNGLSSTGPAGIVDRGILTVSWFDGTSAIELQEHVRTSVLRKLGLEKNVDLADMRILDDTTDPPEGTEFYTKWLSVFFPLVKGRFCAP